MAILSIIGISQNAHALTGKYFDRAVFVIFENTEYSKTIKQPFFRRLADGGANFTQFYAISRPSQPNYIALTSGTTAGIKTDNNVDINLTNIVDLLEKRGLGWKVYAEGFPGKCFTGKTQNRYARKHNPFISYLSIQKNPARCANIVNASAFTSDALYGRLPNYSFYIPDNRNNAHDTSIKIANDWYQKSFGPLLEKAKFMKDTVLITTFDEGSFSSAKNQIYTSIFGPNVSPGPHDEKLNLYSLLRLIESNWDLGHLGRDDVTARELPDIWTETR